MKFLCDRCKTRYSIGDERVRGKILKIRCKNCANVITVREGMGIDPDAPSDPMRAKKSTTIAPPPFDEGSASPGPSAKFGDRAPGTHPGAAGRSSEPARAGSTVRGSSREPAMATAAANRGAAARDPAAARADAPSALNAAFGSAVPGPEPTAAPDEWYVSIDGEQAGPYSLAEAQRWIAQKPFDADLHCWSDGFDDWLPVDKVSHFRGLRKRPPAAAPPRTPGAPRGNPAPGPAAAEDEPKPLFAATMATLERGKPAVTGLGLPTPPAGSPSARATPPGGTPITGRGSAGSRGGNGAPPPARPDAKPAGSADPRRATGGNPTGGPAKPTREDPFDRANAGSARGAQPTALHAGAADARGPQPPAPSPGGAGAAAGAAPGAAGGDDELHIGEVSRVVKLTDLARSARASTAPSRRTATPPVGTRVTGSFPSVSPPEAPEFDPSLSMMPVVRSHRRGLITLIAVALAMVLGVIGAVVLFVVRDVDTTGGSLGTVHAIDTSRPEDPITHRPMAAPAAPAPAPTAPSPSRPSAPRVRTPSSSTGGQSAESPPPGNALASDEIEDVARKHQDITNRCYQRSQRGAGSILIGDVKKIAVTLTIDRDGNVSELQLSDHAGDNLGKCLTTTIRAWKFRPSAGGTFRFSLNFVNG